MVTAAELHYSGSITIDRDLLAPTDILPGERVQIVNMNNGARIETYVIGGRSRQWRDLPQRPPRLARQQSVTSCTSSPTAWWTTAKPLTCKPGSSSWTADNRVAQAK